MKKENTKKLGQEPAFPTEVEYLDGKLQECFQTGNHTAQYSGISIRLYIATMAMQGLISGVRGSGDGINTEELITSSLHLADEMLKQATE